MKGVLAMIIVGLFLAWSIYYIGQCEVSGLSNLKGYKMVRFKVIETIKPKTTYISYKRAITNNISLIEGYADSVEVLEVNNIRNKNLIIVE